MLGVDARPGDPFEDISNSEAELGMMGIADSHNESTIISVRSSLYEDVESEMVVGTVVRFVPPYPCAALNGLDQTAPDDAGWVRY